MAAALGLLMSGCALQRYEYTTVSPVRIYEGDHMASRRFQDIPAGETVFISRQNQLGSLYLVPVNYKGHTVYAYAPELQYRGKAQSGDASKRAVSELSAYEKPGDNTAPSKKTYRSYPGGMIFISVDEEVTKAVPQAVAAVKEPKGNAGTNVSASVKQ